MNIHLGYEVGTGKAVEEEVLLLRRLAEEGGAVMLRGFALFAECMGGDREFVARARLWADEIERWQEAHGLRMKVPALPAPDTRHPETKL